MAKSKRPCPTRKMRYKSRMQATRAMTASPLPVGAVYRCPECRDWHLTSKIARW